MEFTLGETSIAPPVVWVDHFDGSKVWIDSSTPIYEVGNFLGGGAAGTVYEAVNLQSKRHFALKILNPLGYKLTSPSLLRRCTVIWKGSNYTEQQEAEKQKLLKENVWWLVNSATKQYSNLIFLFFGMNYLTIYLPRLYFFLTLGFDL